MFLLVSSLSPTFIFPLEETMPLTLAMLSVIVFRSAPPLQARWSIAYLLKSLIPTQKNSSITFLE